MYPKCTVYYHENKTCNLKKKSISKTLSSRIETQNIVGPLNSIVRDLFA
jgi:hypothetical protein